MQAASDTMHRNGLPALQTNALSDSIPLYSARPIPEYSAVCPSSSAWQTASSVDRGADLCAEAPAENIIEGDNSKNGRTHATQPEDAAFPDEAEHDDKLAHHVSTPQEHYAATRREGMPSSRPRAAINKQQLPDAMHTELLIYVGLVAIAKAVGAGPLTIKRWIREEAFPARRCSDGVYRATAQSMKDWFNPPFPGMTDSLTSRQWAVARNIGICSAEGFTEDMAFTRRVARNTAAQGRLTRNKAGSGELSGTMQENSSSAEKGRQLNSRIETDDRSGEEQPVVQKRRMAKSKKTSTAKQIPSQYSPQHSLQSSPQLAH